MEALGTKVGSSARSTSALDHCAVSPAFTAVFFMTFDVSFACFEVESHCEYRLSGSQIHDSPASASQVPRLRASAITPLLLLVSFSYI